MFVAGSAPWRGGGLVFRGEFFPFGREGDWGRGMLVSMLVYSSRVDVWGSMMGELVADGLSDGVFV